jgi:hypothetical protein
MRMKKPSAAMALLVIVSTLAVSTWAQPFQWDSPIGVVMRLYHDYAYQSVIDQNVPYDNLTGEPESVLEQYFDPELTRLVLADQKCADTSEGICNIDFMVMWDSQDAKGVTVEIKPTGKANIIEVILKYPGFPSESLMYTVTKTTRGYRVHDIKSKKWSLIGLLNGRFPKP